MSADNDDFHLNPLVWDPSWSRLPEKEETGGYKNAQAQAREDWVVRLRFLQDNDEKERFGTGFFLNIPGANFYIILTAGHNIVDKSGNRSTKLQIDRHGQNKALEPIENQVFICPSYHGQHTPEYDYGAILIPRQFKKAGDKKPSDSDLGFGFALNLGYEELREKKLELSGYYPHEEAGRSNGKKQQSDKKELQSLDTCSGDCLSAQDGHLVYRIETAQGLSGSPVFMPYNSHETVVAIHNNGPVKRGKGSSGARLNANLLKQVFQWADIIQHNKALKVDSADKKDPHPDPLYLHFPSDEEYAWVHWGEDGLDTAFDVFPAYASTPIAPINMLHVFQHCPPSDWSEDRKTQKWVLWDVMTQGVTLTDTLQQFCFVELNQFKKTRLFSVIIRAKDGKKSELWQLVLNSDGLTDLDRQMGTYDGAGVSLDERSSNIPIKVCSLLVLTSTLLMVAV
ncbi:uncharacterized protein N7483_002774 [Penicillium malachiteum]|uniref:uncharacterized protein n=1 Tax=Penicillium malachiteum TaxID=1324776 RepID=UPI002547FF4F|nr:uncharacterized protein N7483_002774 [Penicillium malachiteum]KAJ5737649.1 hypothetical protein N7483_002774 [Penicillium malachiteum]